jgi:molybdopterin-binding protein
MQTLNAEQAAKVLHLTAKRVRILAREGKLPASRVGRQWLFREEDLERLVATGSGRRAETLPLLSISARNHLRGRVRRLTLDGLMAEVQLDIGGQELVAVITRSSAERLRLKVGDEALAIVKSTEVIIGKHGANE